MLGPFSWWLLLVWVGSLFMWTTPAAMAWIPCYVPSTTGTLSCCSQKRTNRQHEGAGTKSHQRHNGGGGMPTGQIPQQQQQQQRRRWAINGVGPHGMIAPQQLGSFETLNDFELISADGTTEARSGRAGARRVRLHNWVFSNVAISDDITKYHVDYQNAWDFQKALLKCHINRLEMDQQVERPISDSPLLLRPSPFLLSADDEQHLTSTSAPNAHLLGKDTVIFLEHTPVYTLGTASDEKFVKQSGSTIPVIRMDRGGEVTYHGPGQLTVYPVLDLRNYKQDIHWYVRALEEVVILALQECGLNAVREPDVTGVWVDHHKVAAVGVKCKRWITQHGFAVNVTPESLGNFEGIVPCGLEGRCVGCVNDYLPEGQGITVEQMALYVRSAFEEVFRVELVVEANETTIVFGQ